MTQNSCRSGSAQESAAKKRTLSVGEWALIAGTEGPRGCNRTARRSTYNSVNQRRHHIF